MAVYAVVVCLSVTSPCSTKTAKSRIMQTMPHDSPVFWCQRSQQNSNGITPNGGAKCRWGQVKIGNFRQITRYNSKTSTVASIVNLVRLQIYYTERPPLFAARLPWCCASHQVCQQQLILAIIICKPALLTWCCSLLTRQHRVMSPTPCLCCDGWCRCIGLSGLSTVKRFLCLDMCCLLKTWSRLDRLRNSKARLLQLMSYSHSFVDAFQKSTSSWQCVISSVWSQVIMIMLGIIQPLVLVLI